MVDFSERRPVPTIERYEEELKQQEEDHAHDESDFTNIGSEDAHPEDQVPTENNANDTSLASDEPPPTAAQEKQTMMDAMAGPKEKPTEQACGVKRVYFE